MGFERVEDTMRLDSRTGLARLAEDTGGFLVDGTNNLRDAFRRIDEDSQFHYLLTYSPTDTNFDGKFRRIDVRPHARARGSSRGEATGPSGCRLEPLPAATRLPRWRCSRSHRCRTPSQSLLPASAFRTRCVPA